MSAELERRYSRLLRLYPADYRRARGPEVLETLLESAEAGRRRPAAREVAALTVGALRVRAGYGRPRDATRTWLAAFRAGALMLLVDAVARSAAGLALDFGYGGPSLWWLTEREALNLVALALSAAAVAAAARHRYRLAVAAAVVAFTLSTLVSLPMRGPGFGHFWQLPLAVLLLLPLIRRRPDPVTGLLRWAPVIPVLLVAGEQGFALVLPQISGILWRGLLLGVVLGALLWLAVDERVALAVGLLLLDNVVVQIAFVAEGGMVDPAGAAVAITMNAITPAALLVAGIATHRRQARL